METVARAALLLLLAALLVNAVGAARGARTPQAATANAVNGAGKWLSWFLTRSFTSRLGG